MILSVYPLPAGHGPLEQWDRIRLPTGQPVSGGEVVQRHKRVGMIFTEHPLRVRPCLLEHPDCLTEATCVLIREREVVPRYQCVGVIRAKEPLLDG